jgi:hypothetical protein
MTLSIARIWKPSAEEWGLAWSNCPYATYFHSREWAEIWKEYSDGKINPHPVGIELSDGVKIVLPFSERKRLWGIFRSQIISSPAGTFGGWLANTSLDAPQQHLLLKYISKHFSNILWRFNPYETTVKTEDFNRLLKDETYALDLSIGFKEIHCGWTKGHASAARKARKARKAGVEICIAKTPEDWLSYFVVYESSLKRWGKNVTSNYSWALFRAISQRESPNVKLWLAKHNDFVIAGALCFYSRMHVVYWHGAALSSHFEVRPVNLLMYEAIKDATERGFHWFDFNPSGNLEGVKAFKRSFGATPLPSDVINASPLMSKISKAVHILRASMAA